MLTVEECALYDQSSSDEQGKRSTSEQGGLARCSLGSARLAKLLRLLLELTGDLGKCVLAYMTR